MIIAVHCAIDQTFAPCEICDCANGVATIPKWEITGILDRTNICPRRQLTADSRSWIRLYSHYQNGLLFASGGIADQPHAYLEAMAVIDNVMRQERSDNVAG